MAHFVTKRARQVPRPRGASFVTAPPVIVLSTLLIACTGSSTAPSAASFGAMSATNSAVTPSPLPTSATTTPGPTSSAVSATPGANPVIDAVTFTQSLGTSRASIDVANTVGGQDRLLGGEGVVDLRNGRSDLMWTGDGSVREVVTPDGAFLTGDVDGRWLAFPDGTPTSRVADVFAGLPAVPEWTADGIEQIGAAAATRYSGVLRDWTSGMGLNDAEAAAALAAGATIDISAWIDEQGRVVRILRVLRPINATEESAAIPIAASTLIDLSDFGVSATITTPDPSVVSTP